MKTRVKSRMEMGRKQKWPGCIANISQVDISAWKWKPAGEITDRRIEFITPGRIKIPETDSDRIFVFVPAL